jgi:tetratricopeptide (TPR) repeat protein
VKGAKVDGRSDLFSVGCMLYELITGRRPFHSENLMAIFYKITHEEPNFDLVPEGAEYDALMIILKKSLAKELEDRHQTAYEFAVELRDHLKIYSTSASGEHALEDLLDMEPPSDNLSEAAPTNAPGATVVAGNDVGQPTFEVGPTILEPRGAKARGTDPKVMRTTVLGKGSLPTVIQEQRPRTRTAPAARPAPPPPPASGSPVLYIALGALGVALLAAATFIALGRKDKDPVPAATIAAAPQETLAPVVTAPPASLAATPRPTPPPTAAPPPTFAPSVGRSAATMRQAQAAVQAGDYDRAMSLAQRALAEDPSNSEARRLSDSALAGQKAAARFDSAEAALRAGDFTRAMTEADAGRAHAPWDSRAPQLIGRIQRAQEEAQNAAQQREARERQARTAAQLSGVLGQAETALASEKYDAAIGFYDEALKLDPSSQRAISGRSTAIQARVLAQAAASGGGGGRQTAVRAFVASKTTAQSTETRTGNVPEGFEDSPGVTVKKGTQAADLPGKINFDIRPDTVKAGEPYSVKVYLVNEGLAPIAIRDMVVTTKINGKGVTGPVPPQARDVAPGQRALLMNTTETWREETSSWSMEVAVRTARGERYTNQVEWK